MYGLKDTARAWYRSAVGNVQNLGGVKSNLDPTIFIWRTGKTLKGIMRLHVDDFFFMEEM